MRSFFRTLFAVTLRKKILFYGLLLLLFPNLAYLYFSSTEDYLLAGQRQSLAHSANTIATMLHERPRYFKGSKNAKTIRLVIDTSPELEKALQSLDYSDSRIWILDKQKRVLAVQGNLNDDVTLPLQAKRAAWLEVLHQIFVPIYRRVLPPLPLQFNDEWQSSYVIDSPIVDVALSGMNGVVSRSTSNLQTQILVAAQPIHIEDEVVAIVLTEQSTITTQRIVRESFEYQMTVTILCLFIGAVLLLIFADRIATRIQVLRDETESAIDSSGKIIQGITPSDRSDEIGALTRSFHQVLEKLSQYNHYLQNMASRLSHELRTPVAIVNSSLDNLELDDKHQQVYVTRARDGIGRLSRILQSMSEATRLEEIIKHNDVEPFTLKQLLSSCIEGYRMTHTQNEFSLELDDVEHELSGSPDLFVQMLDKIIANAVDFSDADKPVNVRLFSKDAKTCISVTNYGPLLPQNMRGELLDSMISVRENTSAASPHLGLGLFIAKIIAEYHGGLLEIDNLPDHSGVIVTLSIA